jgi:hypothetical protein
MMNSLSLCAQLLCVGAVVWVKNTRKKKKLLARQVLLFAEFTDLRVAFFFAPLSEKLKGWF